ncbi:CDP-alcohol phosphatidyltransferase family protein [Psychromicrobium lacuslunae]|uniref:CDP-diacylglycerol--glycerol-3-phosphate 3-phosphatidyltransferase n=1 Tax=Psychromicrobium lacuslunae TaxID=1618207 RepID=A0A0D4BW17_9MICC|nr:CDP-alcohol phosphatidyltransferase family protein [Psychromicrobium lacuslunae]AJT40498.1 CDP-diacylglycerol--glycerol-3-phosphate 3-phosphatidyltransferase [Psychromicrobium lacuslunae]
MRLIGAGSRPGEPIVDHDRIVTVPNILTVIRFLGVPLFVWLVLARQEYGWGVLVLAIMGSTDWVDGYIARRFNQTSKLGRILDPVADRIALITVAITLVLAEVAPWWLLAVIIIPDAVLFTVSLIFFRWHPDLPVSIIGKLRTAALLVGTPMLLLAKAIGNEPNTLTVISWVALTLGIVGHLIAAYNYFWAIVRKHHELHRPAQHDSPERNA